jgi:hypothetical protein
MNFDPGRYGDPVARILDLDGAGWRLIPLVAAGCPAEISRALSRQTPETLFLHARRPKAALAGLWLYFSAFEQAHSIAQDDPTTEGSLWHAILHRMEPDSGNSAYWYRQAGTHETHKSLSEEALSIVARYPKAGFHPCESWDPFEFIHFCDRARKAPKHDRDGVVVVALEIQRAEWQLLFDYCATVTS